MLHQLEEEQEEEAAAAAMDATEEAPHINQASKEIDSLLKAHEEGLISRDTSFETQCRPIHNTVSVAGFAILGCALRIGLSTAVDSLFVFTMESEPLYFLEHSYLLSLFIGCWMIAVVEPPRKRRPSTTSSEVLMLGLSTGFCGSLTTLSSFLNEVPASWFRFQEQAKQEQSDSRSFLSLWSSSETVTSVGLFLCYKSLQVMLVGLSVSLFGYAIGKHTLLLFPSFFSSRCFQPSLGTTTSGQSLLLLQYLVFASTLIPTIGSAVYLLIDPNNDNLYFLELCFSLLLAPIGALLRWKLSTLNSPVYSKRRIKLGTYLANFFGCCLIAVFSVVRQPLVINDEETSKVELMWHAILTGGIVGFSGSLTTVSTFVSELNRESVVSTKYIYGAVTLFSCYGVILVVYVVSISISISISS